MKAEVAPRRIGGGRKQQWWQQDQQHHVRAQRDLRQTWNEAQDQPRDDQHDRIGRLKTPCHRGERSSQHQQQKNQQLGAVDIVSEQSVLLPSDYSIRAVKQRAARDVYLCGSMRTQRTYRVRRSSTFRRERRCEDRYTHHGERGKKIDPGIGSTHVEEK